MKVGFIGAGKVGCSLGRYFVHHGIPVVGYVSRSRPSSIEAASLTHTESLASIDKLITMCDVLFITVSDDQIESVWNQVKTYPISGKLICHCSGSLSSAIFSHIEETEAFGYSIHPMFPFNSKQTSYDELKDAVFSVEGNEAHKSELFQLLQLLPNEFISIKKEMKAKYHGAAVVASNQMIGLLYQSIGMLKACGFDETQALKALEPLVMQNVKNSFHVGPVEALTGPVERNDCQTIVKHMEVLSQQEKSTYVPLTKLLMEIAQTKHPEMDFRRMEEILEGKNEEHS